MRYRRLVAPLAVAVSLGFVTAACSGGDSGEAASSSTRPRPTTTTVPPPEAPRYPLTGLPVDDPARAARPALIVKIDNAPLARPQFGLGDADIVYEEVVEGGITRFLAVFQSKGSDLVGPVRSVRPIDPAIVTPLGGLFAYSGGAPKFQKMIRDAPVQVVGFDEASDAYHRERSRRAPHNLFSTTERLWSKASADVDAPPPVLEFLKLDGSEAFGGPNARPAVGFSVVLGERTSAGWDWDAGAKVYRRTTNGTPHVDPQGAQLGFQNVVLQLVDYRYTGDVDAGGNRVPEADIVGSGRAFFLSQGTLVPGRWAKASAEAATVFTNELGGPMKLTPGRTWVEFMPSTAVTNMR